MNNPYVKTLEPVWKDTKYVRINEEKLRQLIEVMKQKKARGQLAIPVWDIPNVQPPMDCSLKEWIDFVCWTNVINFAFTNFEPPHNKFTIEYPEGMQWRGAYAMAASFIRAQKEGISVFDPWHMAEIPFTGVIHIFHSIDADHRIPMIIERHDILREVGKVLIEKYEGSWLNLFETADWHAFNKGKGIVEQLIANFPSFRDERIYKDYRLEFHKRAQLLVMMYHGRAFNSGRGFPLIDDIGDIGPICDYELPKVLESPDNGVLEYSPQMKSLIENHYVFSRGEPIETENRLTTAYVMKIICDEAGINMAQADYYVWELGRKLKAPHILVPTTDY